MKKTNIFNYSYLILFVIYPILALRQANITYVNLSVVIRALGLTLGFAVLAWLLLRLILKDWHKAGILTTLGMLLFFSYGHLYLWAAEKPFGPLRHRTMIIIFLLIFAAAAVFLARKKPATWVYPLFEYLKLCTDQFDPRSVCCLCVSGLASDQCGQRKQNTKCGF